MSFFFLHAWSRHLLAFRTSVSFGQWFPTPNWTSADVFTNASFFWRNALAVDGLKSIKSFEENDLFIHRLELLWLLRNLPAAHQVRCEFWKNVSPYPSNVLTTMWRYLMMSSNHQDHCISYCILMKHWIGWPVHAVYWVFYVWHHEADSQKLSDFQLWCWNAKVVFPLLTCWFGWQFHL